MSVVVDTSIWIDSFRGGEAPALEQGLAEGRVLLSPIVHAELTSGAKASKALRPLLDLLRELPLHPTPREHWDAVGVLRRDLAGQGLSVSIPDAHVAQCALDAGAMLLSHARIFAQLAKRTRLRLLA